MPPRVNFPRGARPSPPHILLRAHPFALPLVAPPAQVAYIPKQLDYWGNNSYGDCVSAEEAFAKACYGLDGQGHSLATEVFIPTNVVTGWARQNGYLNGADLSSVMDSMIRSGFQVGNQLYNDGAYSGVDYSNEAVLQAAIAQGPVKIAIDASALPGGAGSNQGWYSTSHGNYRNTDHCVSLAGFGPANWLYQQLGVTLPTGLNGASGYLLFTWSTIGFVDHGWLMGTCTEAWVRTPTTVGVPPLPNPGPGPGPGPNPGPAAITSLASAVFTPGVPGSFTVTTTGTPTPTILAIDLPAGVSLTDNHDGTATLASVQAAPSGVFTFTIIATNGGTPVTQTFTLTIGTPLPTTNQLQVATAIPAGSTYLVGNPAVGTLTTADGIQPGTYPLN